ncbi:chromate efflux transporter [uncultured Roseovarius sp.]|uniref:chromate efflux transporter n=1 Tax=uncultured Roseovarius sp. TaxID=293344 RepID=UPI00261BAE7A|nr:chromate efflux transporter [uncultured Roseovarius sp.]
MQKPTLSDLFRVFGRIGIFSFGGPAAQISLMHTELVDRHKWLKEQQFLGALSFCMLLPGPEAMQLATYSGWRLHGIRGGLLAGSLFVLPGAFVILCLALGYAFYGDLPLVQSIFIGIQAAVVAIVFKALLNLSRKALNGLDSWVLALLGFAAIFVFSVPFPAIIALAALWGFLKKSGDETGSAAHVHQHVSTAATLKTVAIWSVLWSMPLILLWIADAAFLFELGVFFSKLAIVTFGGAYAVLAYMTQAVVNTHGWLTTPQMIDALGLAETTPGPLILVTEFVGLLAGFEKGGVGLSLVAGALTLWVTFTPCFLWIFAGAPYVENILSRPRLKGALAAISAAVVGVILNLSVWFALHVLFTSVERGTFGPVPEISSFSPVSAGFVTLASILFLVLRLPMLVVLALMAGAAAGAHFFA